MIRKSASWIASHELRFLIIATPFMIFPSGRWPLFALGLVALTWICRWVANGRISVISGLEIPVVIIVLMAIIGYSISIDKYLSYTRVWSLFLGILIFFGIINALRSEKHLWAVVSFLAVLAIGIVGIGVIGTDWQNTRLVAIPWLYDHFPSLIRNLPGSGVPRTSEFIHPRLVGITMGMFVSFFLAFLFFSRARLARVLSLVLVIIGLSMILLTQTLAGMAGMLIGLLFLLIWRNRWFLLAIPLGLGGVIAGLLTLGPVRVIQYLLAVDNPIGIAIALRFDMWSRALAMISDMPYTGIGVNTFSIIQPQFYTGFLLGPEPHAHNLYLQTALDLGIPGLIALLCFLAAWIYIVYQRYHASENHEYRILLLGLVAAVLAYITHGFMDAMMLGSKPGVVFWILVAIGIAPIDSSISRERNAKLTLSLKKQALFFMPIVAIPFAIAVINPASVLMNIGAFQAHKALAMEEKYDPPDVIALDRAKATLQNVVSMNTGYITANELLGRIYAWEGNPILAMQSFARRVAMDGAEPLLRYFPSGRWLRQLHGKSDVVQNDWQDLVQIYSQWGGRYPGRAGQFAEIGIIWQCYLADPIKADSIIKLGIDANAKPIGLLEYYQKLVSQGNNSYCGG